MPVTVNAENRARILRFASVIAADKTDAIAVSQAALPLLEWAERAEGRSDLRARMDALARQYGNIFASPPSGDPAGFVEAAKIHYDFITSGPDEAKTTWDEIEEEVTARAEALLRACDDDDQGPSS